MDSFRAGGASPCVRSAVLLGLVWGALVGCEPAALPTQGAAPPIQTRDTLPTRTDSGTTGAGFDIPGVSVASALAAELPRALVATAYPVMTQQVRVAAGDDLQAAINSAQPGDELLLAPGATYVGNFRLPDNGDHEKWIVIRSDLSDEAIGSVGMRMTPGRAEIAGLARIMTPNNMPAIATDSRAHHWRLTGLEIGGTGAAQEINGIIRFGDGSSAQNTLAFVAHDLILDRSYVRGLPTQSVRRCLALNSAASAIVDSWLSECHSNNGDSQGIVGWNGPGPFLIRNNHIEGGHQVLFFGGSDPAISELSPSDITVIGNHLTRPIAWRGIWQAKTLVETKNARRLLVEGNVIENVYQDAQAGFAVLIKSENQDGSAPWSQSTDVTLRYNLIRNVGSGVNLAANPGGRSMVPAARITINDNVLENLGVSPFDGEGTPLQLLGGLSDIVIAHNAWSNAGRQAISFDGGVLTRLVVHSNVLPHGTYGVKGTAAGVGSATLRAFAPGALFSHNLMIGANCSLYPATTVCPSSIPSDLPLGYDGRVTGADRARVDEATRNAIVAP